MVIKSKEGFLIKFCAFRRRSVSGGKERNVSKYENKNSKNRRNKRKGGAVKYQLSKYFIELSYKFRMFGTKKY